MKNNPRIRILDQFWPFFLPLAIFRPTRPHKTAIILEEVVVDPSYHIFSRSPRHEQSEFEVDFFEFPATNKKFKKILKNISDQGRRQSLELF